jgi:hypothetical protein
MEWVVQRDWRDDRIAELEAELAAKDARIPEQATRIADQDYVKSCRSATFGPTRSRPKTTPKTIGPRAAVRCLKAQARRDFRSGMAPITREGASCWR